MKSEDY